MAGPRTLPEALAGAAGAATGYCFVVDGVDIQRPYSAIRDSALRVARSLQEAGLRRGDLVALILPDAEQYLTALFGASIAGVVPASLYPPSTSSDLPRYLELTANILRSSEARAVIAPAALADAVGALRRSCPHLEVVLARETLDAPPIEPGALPSLDDIAFVQFTSGSTSAPKGVALTHRNVSANVDAINGPAGLATRGDDVGVSWLPLNHDMGLVGMGIGPVYAARPAVLMPPALFVRRPVEWLRAITRHGGTVSFAPNFAFDLCVRRIKERELAGLDLSSWRIAGCGAEPIHGPTLAAFAAKFASVGFRESSFFPTYGLAEHVLAATFPTRSRSLKTETRSIVPGEDIAVTIVSCGRPFPDHRLAIVDPCGAPVTERQIGEIVLQGPSVMLGYYKQDALTAQTIRSGWLHTGDLGYLSDGELYVCGRLKDIIIVNGRKFFPQDLEWAIDDLSGVRRGRVVAFGDSAPGRADRVIIVVEASGTVAPDPLTEAIRRQVGDLFGLYVDDVAIVPGGTIGRTTSGKVQRAAMKAQYKSMAGSAAVSAPGHED
jgi:fatty-acyl-CoA synthase